MTHRRSRITILVVLVQTLQLATACLGSGSRHSDPRDRVDSREGRAPVLRATVPAAVKAATQTSNGPPAAAPADADASESRPGRLLIYSAITGHQPLDNQSAPQPSQRYLTPAEQEAARARSIEKEISEELARQEQIDTQEAPRSAAGRFQPTAAAAADPISAPYAPTLRDVPSGLFNIEEVTIPAGRWQNPGDLKLLRRSLDADRDGKPEEIRYEDMRTGQVIRTEHDTDYDGKMDSWVTYETGKPVVRVQDNNGDGRGDSWERFVGDRAVAKTLDTNGDGVKDTFYRYTNGELQEKLRDANDDGTIDRIDTYRDHHLIRTEEDRSLNGWMETWTSYEVVANRDVVAEVKRDSRDHGEPDVIETYETRDGRTTLTRREEDLNGDGQADVISIYENGRLVRKAISDEALSPL